MYWREINIYATMEAWMEEKPDVVLKGNVEKRDGHLIEIEDENGYTQLINMNKIFAIVYER